MSSQVISQKQEDLAAEKTASQTVLTQEIPSQIPGFVDCAEEELQRKKDNAEIVEEFLASIKDRAAAKKGEES